MSRARTSPSTSRGAAFGLCVFALLGPALSAQQLASASDLERLSIEELAQIKVTSVSKTEEPVSQAAAAVYVITEEAIRRSGATTIPEILRLAPNLHVARLDANTYAISARGFNQPTGTANKLLVLIDGRVVYSPLFSGTFWDAQKTFVPDIDRIEVISGPGGSLWGGNAVNGVINIITKDSLRTRDLMIEGVAGTLDQRLAARLGSSMGATGSFRVYAFGIEHGSLELPGGQSAGDSWDHIQGGFRADWRKAADVFTLQGDGYKGTGIGTPGVIPAGKIDGANVSVTWERNYADRSGLRVQAYADTSRRLLVSGIDSRVHQLAFDSQYTFPVRGRHSFVIGGGYRLTDDEFEPGPGTVFLDPASRTLGFANVFAQDSIALGDSVRLSLGLKAEHNSYSGVELMPDIRAAWSISDRTMLWSSIGRAVRIPSRFDTDLVNRGILNGDPDFQSEELIAYEVGYRGLISRVLSLSVSGFYNSYDQLRTVEATPPRVFPLKIGNGMRGETMGVEAWADYSPFEWWRISAGLATLDKNLRLEPGSADVFGTDFAGNDPRHHWSLRSGFDLPGDVELDFWLRNVDELKNPAVDQYLEADVRAGWAPTAALEVSIIGQNLLNQRHLEFVNTAIGPREIPRSYAVAVRWTP